MEMMPKERILACIKGEKTDRLAFSPFLAYWWEAQPKALQNRGQLAFLEEMGADPMLRGFYFITNAIYRDVEQRVWVDGKFQHHVMETPVGSLETIYTYAEGSNTWFLTGHPVKNEEDLKTLIYIMEHAAAEYAPDYKSHEEEFLKTGDRALIMPLVNPFGKTPFQTLVETWMGTEELVFALADYPELVEECLFAMNRVSDEGVRKAAEAFPESFIFWEDSSTTNISPAYFEKYVGPVITNWANILHQNDKLLIHHACGHIKDLLPFMAKTGVDMIESVSPPPTGNVELWEAKAVLPPEIGLIGGIEPTVLLNSGMDALLVYTQNLIGKMRGGRYVLANSDSCPPGVEKEKFFALANLVKGIK